MRNYSRDSGILEDGLELTLNNSLTLQNLRPFFIIEKCLTREQTLFLQKALVFPTNSLPRRKDIQGVLLPHSPVHSEAYTTHTVITNKA